MPIDLSRADARKLVLEEINGNENKERKTKSLREVEMFNDKLHQYVYEHLRSQFDTQSVKEMPIISSINLARRLVKEEASVYSNKAIRSFSDTTDDQNEKLELIYDDMKIDTMLQRSNESFKLQGQNLIQVVPRDGKLKLRVYRQHHYDVVPHPENPEEAIAIIVSSFDKDFYIENRKNETPTGYVGSSHQWSNIHSDTHNQKIADPDDYKASLRRYVVWTPTMNFIMDGAGTILSESVDNPIYTQTGMPVMPFIDIAGEKDFEYFIRNGGAITDFTVQYNAALSDMAQIVRLQGFAQAYLKGPDSMIPQNVKVGPTTLLRLPVDETSQVESEFGFASPNPDLEGSRQFIELLLANFFSSRGQDPKIVSGKADAHKFTSGIERLLSLAEQFKASKEDFALYEDVERKVFKLIMLWHNTLRDSDLLDDRYKTDLFTGEEDVSVTFAKPEMIQTESDILGNVERKIELGLISRIDGIMEFHNMSREQAVKKAQQIDMDESNVSEETEDREKEDLSGVRS